MTKEDVVTNTKITLSSIRQLICLLELAPFLEKAVAAGS